MEEHRFDAFKMGKWKLAIWKSICLDVNKYIYPLLIQVQKENILQTGI